MFVDTFIRRPILASVCSLVLILAGVVAIPTMPVAQYPALAPPQVNVTAVYTGANAQEVETAVTTPLEQAINGVEGMLYMTSSSTNSGVATITVTFDITRDQDLAAGRRPEPRQPGARPHAGRSAHDSASPSRSSRPASSWPSGVYSEKGEYDSLFLSNYLDVYVKDALKRVPGVGDVIIFGERKYSMRLWLDPDRLAARGITAGDVVNALREQNVQVAAGSLGQAPAPAGQMYQLSVRAAGPAARGVRVRQHHRQERRRRLARPAEGRRPRGARRGDLRRATALPGRRGGRLRRHPAADRQRARRRARRVARSWTRLAQALPAGDASTRSRSTRPTSSRSRSARC